MARGFARYLARRTLRAAVTVLGMITLVFLLVRVMPGDPVDTMLGEQASPEERAALRHSLGLDAPMPLQYARFLGSVADGSLGRSFRKPEATVRELLGEQALPTAALALAALLIAWTLALPLGVLAASRPRTKIDALATGLGVVGIAIPHLWLGPLLVLVFAVKLRWLPLPGGDAQGGAALLLPALTIGTGLAAVLTRQTRAAMLEVLSEPYVNVARAKGLSELRVLTRHALPNALVPIITIGAAQLGALLSGAVITERIFERRGLGTLFMEAFFTRDLPVIQGCVLVFGVVYVLVQLGVDVLQSAVDPRVRLG